MLAGGSNNATLSLLATLGISSLFLFAGLEIDVPGLRRALRALLIHLGLRSQTLAIVAWGTVPWLGMSWQISGSDYSHGTPETPAWLRQSRARAKCQRHVRARPVTRSAR